MTIDTKMDLVPHSQYRDVEAPDQRSRACGICAVRSALLGFGDTPSSVDEMIEEGIASGGYCKAGWRHDYFVQLFRDRGFACERREGLSDADVVLLRDALITQNPVLVSVRWRPALGEPVSHLILLTGVRETEDGAIEGFYFLDSMRLEPRQYAKLDAFVRDWRGFAIFPSKKPIA